MRGGTGCLVLFASFVKISIHPPHAGRDECATGVRRLHDFYFNPPAPCGAGQLLCGGAGAMLDFNPPAPCGAGRPAWSNPRQQTDFNPPAPCGAGLLALGLVHRAEQFQSTRPMRGGTVCGLAREPRRADFNPPAPCGAGPKRVPTAFRIDLFQSTRPMRGGTIVTSYKTKNKNISIHPPHAGRDNTG